MVDTEQILSEIISINEDNLFLKYIVKRLRNNKYRGLHISQHNRYDLRDIEIVLRNIQKVAGTDSFAIPPGDYDRDAPLTSDFQNFQTMVNGVNSEMGRGTINSLKKNFFPDLEKMGFLVRENIKPSKTTRSILYGRLMPSAIEFIKASTLIEKYKKFTDGIDKLFGSKISELAEMIYLSEYVHDTISIYEFMFIFSDSSEDLDKIELLDSYRSLKKHERSHVITLVKKYAHPDNFDGNKTVKKDFHNWKNQAQQIMRLLKTTVYFEVDQNKFFRLNVGSTGFFQEPTKRSVIPKREYFTFHKVEKRDEFELHHIVPISSARNYEEAKMIDDYRNLIYIHRSRHRAISQNGNRNVILVIDPNEVIFSTIENGSAIHAGNGDEALYTKDAKKIESIVGYHVGLLESILEFEQEHTYTANELRRVYIKFFVERGHVEIPSASLVPENDPSVLFTTAGMHSLVPYLKGEPHPAGTRLVNVQKCVRTGDIDAVGDETHLTFFEMLGNWSLGDYFKDEAIRWSYEFLTTILGIDASRLAVSVFGGDDDAPRDEESARVWRALGIPEARIAYLGKEDNWWPAGGKHPGPQGPDSEMFYWTGSEPSPEAFDPKDARWVEIWNDVFMQFDRTTDGRYEPLAQQNVDTGMGLERTVAVLQGASSVYETELFASIMRTIADAAGEEQQHDVVSMRIVADHVRTSMMMIADGVVPSNKDQGYILRRLIRRAVRRWNVLGAPSDRMQRVFDAAVSSLDDAYPVLRREASVIWRIFDTERAAFSKTLAKGLRAFEKMYKSAGHVGGAEAFVLFSTYGFPLELTEELVREQGAQVHRETFEAEFARHQEISRAGSEKKFAGGLADHSKSSTQLHTATHLLHQALRLVLGDHVFQRGSNITQERLRFDFSHDGKMTDDQRQRVEDIVNEQIRRNLPVSFEMMSVKAAKAAGAIGLFEDRYARMGDSVKVYTVGDEATGIFSREICGGPHVTHTGDLGGFSIIKEEASSAGVRRIKAVVGEKKSEVRT